MSRATGVLRNRSHGQAPGATLATLLAAARSAALTIVIATILGACASRPPAEGEGSAGPTTPAERGNRSPYRVHGRTYRVLRSSRGYREVGTASWYGPKFNGRPTSSGEVFDMHQLTAAHKTLPLPTIARVTHLDNGRSVTVRINDRGPFKDDRIIDLSFAAARALDMVDAGTARVEVIALEYPQDTAEPVVIEAQGVFLQLGAFALRDNALSLLQRLRSEGIERAQVFTVSPEEGRFVHRVRIGPLDSADRAEALAADLVLLGYERPRLVFE